jgi:hypothetical protein
MQRGVYQLQLSALTRRECYRLTGGNSLATWLRSVKDSGAYVWLPPDEWATVCDRSALSDHVRDELEAKAELLHRFGYCRGMYMKARFELNDRDKDSGGYFALHDDGLRHQYVHVEVSDRPEQTVLLRGTLLWSSGGSLTLSNHALYPDMPLRHRIVERLGASVNEIDQRLCYHLSRSQQKAMFLASLDQFRAAADAMQRDIWHSHVDRGLYVKVSDEEEAAVLKRFGVDPATIPSASGAAT